MKSPIFAYLHLRMRLNILTPPLLQSVPISTESMTTEELEKYYHKLTKKHGQMSVEIVKCGSALR